MKIRCLAPRGIKLNSFKYFPIWQLFTNTKCFEILFGSCHGNCVANVALEKSGFFSIAITRLYSKTGDVCDILSRQSISFITFYIPAKFF